jgi:hypothetical protein
LRTLPAPEKAAPVNGGCVMTTQRSCRQEDSMSDIKFDGEFVIIEGNGTRAATLDLMLDAPSRRTNTSGFRRALVHDFGDGLTMNYANDYPSGVAINSARTISGHNNGDWIEVQSRVVDIAGTDVMLDSPGRRSNTTPFRRAMVHDFNDGLTLNWNRDYPGGVTINGPVNAPDSMTVDGRDVAALLDSLQAQITAQQSQIDALEARVDALEAG